MEKARGRTLGAGRIDRAKVEATTEHDTRCHMIEDGLSPDNPLAGFRPLSGVAEIRHRTEMSQDAFAKAIHVPVKTIRNWEQGRSRPDPAAQALLAIVADDPVHAFGVIQRHMKPMSDYAPAALDQYPKPAGRVAHNSDAVKKAAGALGDAVTRDLDAPLKGL